MKAAEHLYLITFGIVAGFLFGYKDLATDYGASSLFYFIVYAMCATLLVYLVTTLQKMYLARRFIEHTVSLSVFGNGVGIILALMTGGQIVFFVPPYIVLKEAHYAGSTRHYIKRTFFPLMLSIIVLCLIGILTTPIPQLMRVSFLLALFYMIPVDFVLKIVEKASGHSIASLLIFESFYRYLFVATFVLVSGLALAFDSAIFTIVFSLITTVLVWISYYTVKELND